MKNKICLAVISCDAYRDLWQMFDIQFQKNWPDCPFDRYFVSNKIPIQSDAFHAITLGDDVSWSDNLIKLIDILELKYSYVLLTLEDVPLIQRVNQNKMNEMITKFYELNGNFLSFNNKPKYTKRINGYFGEIEQGSIYRPTTEYSLWKISTLKEILVPGESAWEFEKLGAVRSDAIPGFYIVYNHELIKTCHTVVKGKWLRPAVRKMKKYGYYWDGELEMLTFLEQVKFSVYLLVFTAFHRSGLVHWRWRRKIISLFNQRLF